MLVAGGSALWISAKRGDAKLMFLGHLLVAMGGSLYRFDPTTLAFQPRPGAFYFPAAMEILISGGFVALVIAIFMLAAKVLAILPAPRSVWYEMEAKLAGVQPASSALTRLPPHRRARIVRRTQNWFYRLSSYGNETDYDRPDHPH